MNEFIIPASPGQDRKIRAAIRRGRRGSVSGESSTNTSTLRSYASGSSTTASGPDDSELRAKSSSSNTSTTSPIHHAAATTATATSADEVPQEHSIETLNDMVRFCKGSFLFSDLQHDEMLSVARRMTQLHVTYGTRVIEQGAEGDYFYVVAAGTFRVMVDEIELAGVEYGPGTCFGELALMYSNPRAATVWCTSPTAKLYALERETFRCVLCGERARRREMFEQFLLNLSIFQSQSSIEISRVADVLLETRFAPNEVVIHHGDANLNSMNFYLIVEGEAQVLDSQGSVLRRLHPGEYFGERSLIDRIPRTATVKAITSLVCGALDVAAFERLLGEPVRKEMRARIGTYPLSPRIVMSATLTSRDRGTSSEALVQQQQRDVLLREKMGSFYVCGEEFPTCVTLLKDKKFATLHDYQAFFVSNQAADHQCAMKYSVCGEDFPTNIKELGGQTFVSLEDYIAYLSGIASLSS